jgi:signal transduction histidine kinase
MGWLAWGLIAAWGASLAAVAAYARRRTVRLAQRVQQAERLAELGTLTGGLAHEIKNPLSTVQLNLQLLREDLDPAHPSHGRIVHRLDTVRREASRLRDILDDFLKYAGKLELVRQEVELNGLLQDLVDFFLPQAQSQRVQLRLRRSDEPIAAPIDPRLLKQAVLNLMINALQSITSSGRKGGELILSVSRDGPEALIEVIDTGKGIAPEDRERIFQAYYSTRRGGSGLGLAMTRRIIQEHGGRLEVRSELDKGSDFMIFLPMKP